MNDVCVVGFVLFWYVAAGWFVVWLGDFHNTTTEVHQSTIIIISVCTCTYKHRKQ